PFASSLSPTSCCCTSFRASLLHSRILQRKMSDSAEARACFMKWKYSRHFTFLKQADKNITVICKQCPGEKKLSAAVSSTSNLLKHLTRQHRQSLLTTQKVSEGELKKMIAGYVVEEMLPLRTVESPSFRCILNKIPACGKKAALPDRKTFSTYLDKCYADMEMELKETFESLEYISTTADIWTSHNKSFLGMTAHWIDPSTFVRGHAALACERVRGRRTYVIGNEIEQVHSAYGLNSKVTATVTDNGSNFIKAFRMFQKSDSDEESEEDEEVTFTDVEQTLSTESEGQFSLPPHLRCASHTLNLIFHDVEKWLQANEAKFIYRSATSKCSAMWTKANCSSVASELVDNFFKKKLIVPVSTRWSSFHDALSRITDIPLAELNTVCTQFGIKCFTDREYLFLKEYCIVLKPLTVALDILQGEEHCYFGILLPTLEILMSRTLALQDELKLTASLPDIIAIKVRFSSMMDNKEAKLAAVTLPKFKLRWIREEEKKDMVRPMLTTECHHKNPANSTDDFFSFEEDDCTYSAETEVMEYLKSAGSELGVLSQFPRIKTISLYNTATPSSAPVERLFSLGNLVLTPRRNRLSSERFERLTLMRYNNFFKNNTAK
uniref:BED-type domain-containing protein n=1 Tax=Oreochromis aureus TaxID=47969 RepID=A0AAZ1Y1Y5_OREAU